MFDWYPWEGYLFLKRDGGRVDLGKGMVRGKGLGGKKRRKLVRMEYMREE